MITPSSRSGGLSEGTENATPIASSVVTPTMAKRFDRSNCQREYRLSSTSSNASGSPPAKGRQTIYGSIAGGTQSPQKLGVPLLHAAERNHRQTCPAGERRETRWTERLGSRMRARVEERRYEQDVCACPLRGDQLAMIVDRRTVEPVPMSARGSAGAAMMSICAPCTRQCGIAREENHSMARMRGASHSLEQSAAFGVR